MSSAAPPEAKSPTQDVQKAHSDFVAYLNASHGETYDTAMAVLEEKTKLKRDQLSYGVFALFGAYLIFGALAQIVCNLIGFAYPAYASVKAIRTKSKDDDTQWLVYWTVFAFFSLIDFFAEVIFQYFPFYYLAKAIFLLYLYLPQTNGALYMYNTYADPFITYLDAYLEKKNK